uniref:Uncharacterized protein n=1 Tax=Xiphophorus couchianus TaxID=32473 RepID=A0A3B5M2W3_9TELE
MQAFLKGATIQSSRPQKDKVTAGPSAEKKAKAVPWVEKYQWGFSIQGKPIRSSLFPFELNTN